MLTNANCKQLSDTLKVRESDHESGSDFIQTPDGDIELIGGTRED